ncbi:MAG: ribonuclease Z [Proteobacteria bacterium]|nr:ribonuclease Z [Pseudomonadota bacterium]
MPPDLIPRFINGPFEDPGLFIPFRFRKEAVLMDMGDISPLPSKDILKINHAFVTHTHMDHFFGFDRLLRLLLGRDKHLHIYGPKGFLENTEAKLSAYSWNLVENYKESLRITAHEIREDRMVSRSYSCRERFSPGSETLESPFRGVILEKPGFTVSAKILDHGIPVLAFVVKERFHIHIKKNALMELGLSTGPWLTQFKKSLYGLEDPDSIVQVPAIEMGSAREFRLEELKQAITVITPGQKIAYVSDVAFHKENAERIIDFVRDADRLFIEACFLDQHKEIAGEKHHLTARQAGEIAARAKVKHFDIFHFSPRYQGQEQSLYEEARQAFTVGIQTP